VVPFYTFQTSSKNSKKSNFEIDEEISVQPDSIPPTAKFNGYRNYDVQELIMKRHNIRFQLAEYITEDGKTLVGELPTEYQGRHYGPGLVCYVMNHKLELLQVLDCPELPLHNNAAETDIREYVTRRKISGGTRSELGRKARDTFVGLKKTCRKLGISFWKYLTSRLYGDEQVLSLSDVIRAKAAAVKIPVPT
jgi:hypothetical protein